VKSPSRGARQKSALKVKRVVGTYPPCFNQLKTSSMYQGTLTDKDKGETIKFRDKSIFEVMTHFSMLIEDCDLKKIQIKIVNKSKPKEL